MSIEFLDYLKRGRDICIKPKFSGGKTGFRCTPALKGFLKRGQIVQYFMKYVMYPTTITVTSNLSGHLMLLKSLQESRFAIPS